MSFYHHGMQHAFDQLGLKTAQRVDAEKGTPFQQESSNIAAERLALLLQQQDDDQPVRMRPDNTTASSWNKPVSWGSPKDLSGLESGLGGHTGMLTPGNPRS